MRQVMPMSSPRIRTWAEGVAIALAAVLPHLASLRGPFLNDDVAYIRDSTVIGDVDRLRGIFLTSYPDTGLYRPLLAFDYALDHAFVGLEPWGYHAHNLAWYVIGCLLVWAFFRSLLQMPGPPAWAGALLFAVHPVHAEAVDNMSGRSDLLALAGVAGALALFTQGVRTASMRSLVASFVVFVLAAFAKESVVMMAGVAPVVALVSGPEPRLLRRLAPSLPFVVAAPLLVAWKTQVTGGLFGNVPFFDGFPVATRLFTMGSVAVEYVRLLVWPGLLAVDAYYVQAIGILASPTPRAVAGICLVSVVVGATAVLAIRSLAARRSEREGLVLLALALIVVFSFPFSNVIPFGALMAERFILLPSLGVALLVSLVLPPGSRLVWAGFAVVLAAMAGRSTLRALDWGEATPIWGDLADRRPDIALFQRNTALEHLGRGELHEARARLQNALRIAPDQASLHAELGVVEHRLGDLGAAEASFDRALALDPDSVAALNGRGTVLAARGRLRQAEKLYVQVLQIEPERADAALNLSDVQSAIVRAEAYLAAHRGSVGPESDPVVLATVVSACEALDDHPCVAEVLPWLSRTTSPPAVP